MKLGIFCNFGPPHCGGSEEVIKQISHRLSSEYNVKIYSYSQKTIFDHGNGVLTVPCLRGNGLISQINENDHIMVYSDSFWGWDSIVENIDKIVPDVSVSLVGAYQMRERSKMSIVDKFIKNIGRFRVISHSTGDDHKWCVDNNIYHKIIPNGVNLSEFRNNKIDFRDKYRIKSKYIFLNVSNYFYGKGQESLGEISKEIENRDIDGVFVSISSSINYPYDNSFLNKAKNSFSHNRKGLFLRNLSREDVISAFIGSDVFVFTSCKEVAPLVILESRAAGLPWVSFDVGDVSNQKGGIILPKRQYLNKGYIVPDKNDYTGFADNICMIIGESNDPIKDELNDRLKQEMKEGIEMLDWDNIIPEYNKVFIS